MAQLKDIIINNEFIDRWSPIHLFFGLLIGFFVKNRIFAYSIIVGYEIVENVLIRRWAAGFFQEQETIVNIIGDIIVTGIGYEIGRSSGDLLIDFIKGLF